MKDVGFAVVARGHAADDVFEQLAEAIVLGNLRPGSPLPSERVLAEQFGVSRIIVRQALHRLADMTLVRVRQGGASTVCDPAKSTDARVIGLYYRLDPASKVAREIAFDIVEKQWLQGLSLVNVAFRRATPDGLTRVELLAAEFDTKHSEATFAALARRFWELLAEIGDNRIFVMEVGWWYEVMPTSPRSPRVPVGTLAERCAFYRELSLRLVESRAPSEFYLAAMNVVLAKGVLK